MSTYKNLIGKDVNFLSTDPDNDSAEGQIWYNSTAGAFKDLLTLNAWSNGGSLVTEHQETSAAGTQTAGLCFGGRPPTAGIVATEEYDGSGWSNGGDMNTARRGAATFSASTQTAALVFGGAVDPGVLNATEEYNGTSWTSVNNLPAAKYINGGAGIQTAALSFGGYSGTAALATTEEYDGTNWTAGNAMSTARYSLASAGLQTAALAFGGTPPGALAITEEYDGTNWTAGGDMNTARRYAAGCGTQDSALVFGAGPAAVVKTEKYDGTSWSETADMGIAQKNHGGAGLQSAALSCGGESPTNSRRVTQEFNNSVNVITAAAFSSGDNMPEATSKVADGGTQTAAVEGGGQKNNPDSLPTSSSEYNGTSWTAGNSLPSNYGSNTGATGTQTALVTGGANNPTPGGTCEYDGTNWTAGGTLGTSRYGGKTLGTQTAAVTCGGRVSPPTLNNVEEYDGSSWTAVTAMPIATREQGGFGTQTAGVVVSGFQGPSSPPVSPSPASRGALGFDYDGTNWTAGTSALIAGSSGGAAGIQTVGFFLAGGNPGLSPALITTSQTYDGTSYTTNASVARSRATQFGITSARTAAVGTAAMIFGGGDPSNTPQDTAATEEYNVATTALNIKTITTS